MAPFVYKFKTLKKVKNEQKKITQKALALIEGEIELCNSGINDLKNEMIENRKGDSGSGYKISDLLFQKGCEFLIKKKIENLKTELIRLNEKRENNLTELVQKTKEHKIFDKLEDNYREQFHKEQNQIEMKNLDEIAVQKFVRQET